LSGVLARLRRAGHLQQAATQSDAELLERYVSRRDEGAFEVLVRRHGPMVLGVCRRFLSDPHDAEDAFQATFLVLVRKAPSIVPRGMVGSWLYGTACLAARKARALAARRQVKERQVQTMPEPATLAEGVWDDLKPLLDQAVSGLPEKYRLAVVLCDLEGKTRGEAAQQLGWPEGTVAGRLARARALLARRLTRLGLPLSGGMVAAVLSQGDAAACVPVALVSATVRAAVGVGFGCSAVGNSVSSSIAEISDGVLKTMFMSKLKTLSAVVLMTVLAGGGIGFLTHVTSAASPPAVTANEPQGEARRQASEPNVLMVKNLVLEKIDLVQQTVSVATHKPTAALKLQLGGKAGIKADNEIILQLKDVHLQGTQKDGEIILHLKEIPVKLDGVQLHLQQPRSTKLDAVPVVKGARIFLHDKPAQLSDLKTGMKVTLVLGTDKDDIVVQGIRAD
jgi:RNA polymerase sigma factor (sigma-70 family)